MHLFLILLITAIRIGHLSWILTLNFLRWSILACTYAGYLRVIINVVPWLHFDEYSSLIFHVIHIGQHLGWMPKLNVIHIDHLHQIIKISHPSWLGWILFADRWLWYSHPYDWWLKCPLQFLPGTVEFLFARALLPLMADNDECFLAWSFGNWQLYNTWSTVLK